MIEKPEAIAKILKAQSVLFLSKLKDYGTEDMTEVGLEGVLMRLNEKILRGKNISQNQRFGEESLRDTFMDVMGYAMIGILMLDNDWEDNASKLLIHRTEEAKAFALPYPKKEGDVGFDLYTVEDTIIPAQGELPIDVPTGVSVKLPAGMWAMVVNRSSTPRKMGIEIVPGLIDNGFTGELFACCYNRTKEDIKVEAGTRLAQFVVFNMAVPELKEVEKLPETKRGKTGFGSTGK